MNGAEGGSEPIVNKQVSEDGKTVTETTTVDDEVISTVVTVTDSENKTTTVKEYNGTAEEGNLTKTTETTVDGNKTTEKEYNGTAEDGNLTKTTETTVDGNKTTAVESDSTGTVTKTTVTDTSTDNAKVVTEYVGKEEDNKIAQKTEYKGEEPAKTTVYDDNGDLAKTIEYNAEITGAAAMLGPETGTVERNANGEVVKETVLLDANYLPWGMGQVCVLYAAFIYSGDEYDAALENAGGTFYEGYNFVMVEDTCDKDDPTIVLQTMALYYDENQNEYNTTYYYREEDIAKYGYKSELVRNVDEDWSVKTSYYDNKIVTANYVPPQKGWGTNGYEYNTVFLDENGDPTGVTEYLFTIGVLDQEDIITDADGNVTKTTYEYTHGTANDSIITTTKYENDVKTYSSTSAFKNKLLISDSVFDVDADGNLLKTTSTTYAEDGETPTEAVVKTYKGGEVVQTTTSTYSSNGALASSVTTGKDDKVIEETEVDEDGNSVTKKYDAEGKLVSTTTTSAPNEDGNYTVKQVNADGSSVDSTVDEDGNLIESTAKDTEGNTTETVKVTKESTTTTTYDSNGSTETVVNADGSSVVTVKDAEGNVKTKTTTSVKNADGKYTVVVTDAEGNPLDERVYSANGSYVKTGFKPEVSQSSTEYTGYNQIQVRSTDELCNFLYVIIDGTIYYPSSGYYKVTSGSILVTLNNSFLNTLDVGSHSVSIVSTNGTVATSFTISQATYNRINGITSTPRTGDSSNLALFSALLLVSFSGLVYIPLTLRKKAK